MSILKLPNVGDTATLEIAHCGVVQGEYGEQVRFDSTDETLYLPRQSADRQLGRLNFADEMGTVDYGRVTGYVLTFSRTKSTKPGAKPFWDISFPETGSEKPKANGKPPAASSNVPNQQLPPLLQNQQKEDADELASKIGPPEKPKLAQIYLDATTFILDRIVPLYEAKEIGVSDTACAAMVATLVIQAAKER